MTPSFRRRGRRARAALAIAMLCAGCGSRSTEPPASTPPPAAPQGPTQGMIQVTGTERLAWDQQPMPGASGGLEFAAYLDLNRIALPDVRCTPRPDGNLDCTAQLPALAPGLHVLQLAAIASQNGRLVESSRSAPIYLTKAVTQQPSAAFAPSVNLLPGVATPPDNAATPDDESAIEGTPRFSVQPVAESPRAFSDLAVTPDGNVFAAERLGRVRLLRRDSNELLDALVVDDVDTTGGRGLFSIALHPDYERNRFVYLLYAAQTAADPVFRIVRGREAGGRIGELAVLLDAAPAAADSWGVLRFGPDHRLYAALGEGPDGRGTGASYDGKLLRLEDDGRRAVDNADASPIVATVGGDPAGLLWTAATARLILRRLHGAADLLSSEPGRQTAALKWAPPARPAALAYVASPLEGGTGHLYAGDLGGGLHQIAWGGSPQNAALDRGRVIARELGAVRAVAAAADGSVYFATANADFSPLVGTATVKDFIVRLVPRVRDK